MYGCIYQYFRHTARAVSFCLAISFCWAVSLSGRIFLSGRMYVCLYPAVCLSGRILLFGCLSVSLYPAVLLYPSVWLYLPLLQIHCQDCILLSGCIYQYFRCTARDVLFCQAVYICLAVSFRPSDCILTSVCLFQYFRYIAISFCMALSPSTSDTLPGLGQVGRYRGALGLPAHTRVFLVLLQIRKHLSGAGARVLWA